MDLSTVISVVTINLLLSSDNALAIALASRSLPPDHREKAVTWGSVCAICVQIVLTYMATYLLSIQFVKIIGGIILAWIAVKMITDEDQESCQVLRNCASIWGAIRSIAIANLVMSLDNVLAVAAIVGGNIWLLCLGLLISFPVIMWGSMLIALLLEKIPVLIWFGAVFLGWTAGSVIAADNLTTILLTRLDISRETVSALIALSVSFFAWKKSLGKARITE